MHSVKGRPEPLSDEKTSNTLFDANSRHAQSTKQRVAPINFVDKRTVHRTLDVDRRPSSSHLHAKSELPIVHRKQSSARTRARSIKRNSQFLYSHINFI